MGSNAFSQDQRQLIDQYEQLSPTLKSLVQVASVAGQQGRTKLVDLASKANVSHSDGGKLTYQKVGKELNAIIDEGILQYGNRSQNGPVEVAVVLQDYAFRQAFDQELAAKVIALIDGSKSQYRFSYHYSFSEDEVIRKMRLAFYSDDWKTWSELAARHHLAPYVLTPFCRDTFARLSPVLQSSFFSLIARQTVNSGDPQREDAVLHANEMIAVMASKELSEETITAATDLLSARGDLAGLKKLAKHAPQRREIPGCIAFLQGKYRAARQRLEEADAHSRKGSKRRKFNLPHLPTILYALLLIEENSPESQRKLQSILKTIASWSGLWSFAKQPLETALHFQQNPSQSVQPLVGWGDCPAFEYVISGWIWRWFYSDKKPPFTQATFEPVVEAYRSSAMDWLAAESAAILSEMTGKAKQAKKLATESRETHKRLQTTSIVDWIEPAQPWELGLHALQNLCGESLGTEQDKSNDPTERMIWELSFSESADWLELTPYIQKLGRKGWTKGRKVALSRLYSEWQSPEFNFLTDHDHAICKCLKQRTERNHYGYRETTTDWIQEKLAVSIVDHPRIYRVDERDHSLQISQTQPQLAIEKSRNKIGLSVHPTCPSLASVAIRRESSHRLSITPFTDQQVKVAKLVAELPPIPANQEKRVFEIAASISAVMDVQSDMQGAPTTGAEVEPVSDLVIQLTPYQEGLRAEVLVQPLGEQGPFCHPGVGAASVLATIDGKPMRTNRDLNTESERYQQLLSACPPLESNTVNDHQSEWLFGESDQALELVVLLQDLADQDQLTLLWPRGETHVVAGSPTASSFRVSVRRDRDWFAASGDLRVDDELTIDLMELIDLASASPSRFIPLDDGRFLALTRELRARISDIAAYGAASKKKLRFPPVTAPVLDELLDDVNLKTDKHWKSHLSCIEEAATIAINPPSTLQAELRDYQADGFAWLRRIAHWNSGACLADDMGLGKTIQALALTIDRAFDGPSLVVAPASVGFNWENETRRFAPTLTPKLFRDCDRDQFFADIQAGDLAITSYGLLQSEIERFQSVEWSVILLDEAQAIKNMATKRSQAVMQLQGDFKLILTGTPMENHLGELWNLFRFIVPGLLGSQEDFRKRFAIPIERDQCRATRNRLKKLIQPFLLRRTKSEVLSELPARSESTLEVELSSAEAALYETLRERALQRIEEAAASDSSPGEKHLQVLAELTRLRLACCHPSLVGGDAIDGAKLELFRQKVVEIVDGQHKVLVFSQFVKHLKILRDELDTLGISHQYLDGSTSMKKRREAVEAFQSGEGDVFLISLKAGGTGLNLTAADYVIHMDPWWNPAVEDQATDRAHRIGQSRPVNVYRLITKGTIEEKIVDLHHAKRDLADSLLEGTDSAGKLSTEDLINLLRDKELAEA